MKQVAINGHKVLFYDSIKELTAKRNSAFNQLLLMDMQMGSSMDSVTERFKNLFEYLRYEKIDMARKEATNLHNTFYYMIEGINTRALCLAPFVYKIDKQLCFGYDEEKAMQIMDQLSTIGMSMQDIESIIIELKKKLMANFAPSSLIDQKVEQILTS